MTARIAHFEISAPDDQGIADFYAALLSWNVTPQGPGYALVQTEDGPNGAIIEAPDARVTLGVTVSDLNSTVSRVEQLGGQVLMPATDNGWVTKALVADPAGNVFSLIQERSSTVR